MTAFDLPFTRPILNAAGTLGFRPKPRGVEVSGLGAFVTNPVSLGPRTAASGPRLLRFPGGLLLHTGHPNRGLRRVLKSHAGYWARSDLPVIVHVLAGHPDEVFRIVRALEDTEGVAGIELGLPPAVEPVTARAMITAAVGELPVIVRPGLEDALLVAAEAVDAGASALAIGPPRGALPVPNSTPVEGRLLGPAVFPQALACLRALAGTLPVIFAGGLLRWDQVDFVMAEGAAAVQLDLWIWREGGFSAREESSSARR